MNAERMPLLSDVVGQREPDGARHLFNHVSTDGALRQTLAAHGYVHLPSAVLAERLKDAVALESFRASWGRLPVDDYMNDGGRYRRRRHAVLAAGQGQVWLLPYRPHFQSRAYNALNGGIARRYAQIEARTLVSPVLEVCLKAMLDTLPTAPEAHWFLEAHQFRIVARPGEEGRPTPEGVHRDGVERVFMALVGRDNVTGGVSCIHAPDGSVLETVCLREPLEAMLVDDAAVRHGVTAIRPLEPGREGVRDMLVVTARREAGILCDRRQL